MRLKSEEMSIDEHNAQTSQILVMNETEYEDWFTDVNTVDDIVQDMTDVMTSFCARLYGKRGAANRAKRALKAAEGL